MEAVVLAGGLGTRLRAAVSDVPKPMAPVGGRPFLERLLDYWIGQGVRRAVLAVGYMYDTIRRHFGDEYRGCAIAYSIENHPLGTGGALIQALPLVQDPTFLVLNGDTYFAVPLDALAAGAGQRCIAGTGPAECRIRAALRLSLRGVRQPAAEGRDR